MKPGWPVFPLLALLMLAPASAHAETAFISQILRPIYVATSAVTIANTTTETSIIGAGVGTLVLPANSLQPGDSFLLEIVGRRSAISNPTGNLQIKLNGAGVLATGPQTEGNGSNDVFTLQAWATIRTIGVSGTFATNGFYIEEDSIAGSSSVFGLINTGPLTINTTIDQTISATWTWGVASLSDSITASNFILQKL